MTGPREDEAFEPIAARIRAEHERACAAARVPPAAEVWQRAVRRARLDAQRAAARPITALHAVASACAAGLTCGALTWISPTPWSAAWRAISARTDVATAAAAEISNTALTHAVAPIVALTACLVFLPVALYLVLTDE
ncbi:MAG TPA: hypothetical protein VL309_06990 [Vicinamibacterales bacterium]|jgi:hypothetical protein|nr:hypothetical protein [Vicinamibacterales bacterium]